MWLLLILKFLFEFVSGEPTDADGKTKSAQTKVYNAGSPILRVTKSISGNSSLAKSPLSQPMKSNSPKFINPGKSVALKHKHSRRRSVKHLSNSSRKLLNTSKSASVLTPSKHFVAPMTSRPSSTMSKSNRVDKLLSNKNDENARPVKSENFL